MEHESKFRNQPGDVHVSKVASLWPLNENELYERIKVLRDASRSHTLGRDGNVFRFMPNGGIAGATYDWKDLPRAVVRDSTGELELLVDAYRCGDALCSDGKSRGPPAVIGIYSSEPARARVFLDGIGYK